MVNIHHLVSWLNETYPTRDWDQQCARLVWNAIYFVNGLDIEPQTYDPAKVAYRASRIESLDPWAAPDGAIHYWQHPAEGHVAIDIGGGLVLMTGTTQALGIGGWQCGNNYGITTVEAYTAARRNPYLGWSRTYGQNAPIIGAFATTQEPPQPQPRKRRTMLGLMITDGEGRYGIKGERYFATYDGKTFVPLNEADANAISVHMDAAFANVTYAAWEAYQRAVA